MKTKIKLTVFPVIVGILLVMGFIVIYNLMIGRELFFRTSDIKFFVYFFPITLISALIIQYFIALRLWPAFRSKGKFAGLSLFPFICLITFVCGVIFGFVFWETNSGMKELFIITLTGIAAFAVYWTSNLITLKRLDKN